MNVGSLSKERPTNTSQPTLALTNSPGTILPYCQCPDENFRQWKNSLTILLTAIKKIQMGIQKLKLLRHISRNPEIRPSFPQPHPCSIRPRYSLRSLLVLDRKHPKPIFL
ncbi:hypothetical protein TNCT_145151 [Trichonephila clavata]|uniref:Uncharacterized protein n=1 Tax=Trichonephila clavata TaxID=2740835 RepID=A0A8X6KWT4_TRICU|nr:hypothetical protein TNCT_145151 [Trichonephila clavata]